MDKENGHRQRNSCLTFLADFRALFIKMFLLARRSVGQTITEFILSFVFLGLIFGLRYVYDRGYYSAYQIPRFRPQDRMIFNGSTANTTYYYPGKLEFLFSYQKLKFHSSIANPCTTAIVNNTINSLVARWPAFPSTGM